MSLKKTEKTYSDWVVGLNWCVWHTFYAIHCFPLICCIPHHKPIVGRRILLRVCNSSYVCFGWMHSIIVHEKVRNHIFCFLPSGHKQNINESLFLREKTFAAIWKEHKSFLCLFLWSLERKLTCLIAFTVFKRIWNFHELFRCFA